MTRRNNKGILNGLSIQLTRCRVDQHSSRVRSLMLPIPPPPPAPPAPPSPAAEARDYQARQEARVSLLLSALSYSRQ